MFGIPAGVYRVRVRRVLQRQRKEQLISYLRVYYEGGDKYFKVDNELPYRVFDHGEEMELRRFEIIEEVEEKIRYHKVQIYIKFQETKGYNVELSAVNLNHFFETLDYFKGLKKELE